MRVKTVVEDRWQVKLNDIFKRGAVESAKELGTLREELEILPANEQGEFVNLFVPWALKQLNNVKINVDTTSNEHATRSAIISIMRTLPAFVDSVRPYLEAIMPTILGVIREDSDDIATDAMQLFTDMNKAFRSAVEHYVPSFLDFILEVARDFDNITRTRLQMANQVNAAMPGKTARMSFRLLHDAPVMIVLVFQLHRRFINEYIPRFVPVVISLLEVDATRPACDQPEIDSLEGITNTEATSALRGAFNDYISAQIKVLSFLAYIARGFAPTLRDQRETIPRIIVRLLSRCPPEGAPSRKELLVAIRHILSTELRQAFLPHLETLMDEHLLLGEGYTAYYIFRPAAYSMLADLIHHVRLELSPSIIERVISMYSRALHDPTLPNGIQTMSIKLLLNLVDAIANERFPPDLRRAFLFRVLVTIIQKFHWLHRLISELLAKRRSLSGGADVVFDERRYDPYFDDPLNARPIPTDHVAFDPSRDNIRDLKFQLKTLVNGVKNLVLALRSTPISSEEGGGGSTGGFTADEGEIYLVKLFRDGVLCFDIFHFRFPADNPHLTPGHPHGDDHQGIMPPPASNVTSPPGTTTTVTNPTVAQVSTSTSAAVSTANNSNNTASQPLTNAPGSIPADEKDLMDQFGYIFTLLEPAIFHDVIASNMDFLIERTKENIALVSIPQYFLAISGISRGFAAVLARHLMERFEEIGGTNPIAGAVVLRLFKLLFLAVSVYPEENETVLQPHLADIILSCFRHYPKATTPVNYFLLLRSLFRSIGGGRFDSLYKEVLPLLQTILDELTHLSPSTADPSLRDMYVELCLTTPVRLSNLLPYLSYLMKPVLLALQSGTDLVNQGLRTFELCIDNLTPDFLEPILAPVFTDILSCLWRMLKPPPANQLHSHTAVRLLGKLGGKSRRFLTTPPNYAHRKSIGIGFLLEFRFEMPPTKTIRVPGDALARIAMITLNSPVKDLFTRQQALSFLKRVVAGILGHHGITESLEKIVVRLEQFHNGKFTTKQPPATSRGDSELLMEGKAMARGLDVYRLIQEPGTSSSCDSSPSPSLALSSSEAIGETTLLTDEASRQLLCEVVCALFDAYVQVELREEISAFLTRLYRLFVMLYIGRLEQQYFQTPNYKAPRILACLDFEVISDIMMEYTTVQNEAQAALAWDVLRGLYEQCCVCIPDRELQYDLKIFFLIADKAISACFRSNTWQRVAACRTISRICDLELSLRFYWHHEIRLIRGVLYVMKSLPTGTSARYSEELTGIVFKVLRLANRVEEDGFNHTDEFLAQRRQYFDQVMLALVTELSNPNAVVRDAVKAAFQLLSDIQGCEVTDLLSPLKSRVYGPIFSKPLRALPLHVQVGYIDAITYCLALRPPLLELHEELLRLVNECITVIESDDSALVSRANQPHNASNLLSLRLVCIKLLSTCLSGGAEFQQPRLHPLRNQIVSVFFKTLYARQSELVDVSRAALEQVMAQQHKLPTELLQNGLRPVLQSLGEPRHLNLAAVEGLRRILQLFSHFFKAEIGRKLLDHLHAWADQQSLEGGNGNGSSLLRPSISPESLEVKVITAIMELFCLLPSCGQMFTGELFQVVLQLETVLRRWASSPFRPVLLRFMELYPADAISYFCEHIDDSPVVRLFTALVCSPMANKVVAELSKAMESLCKAFLHETTPLDLRIRYLALIKQYFSKFISNPSGGAVDQHAQVVRLLWPSLVKIGQSHQYQQQPWGVTTKGKDFEQLESETQELHSNLIVTIQAPLENILTKMIADISMTLVKAYPEQVDIAFLMLQLFVLPQVYDSTDLPAFFRGWLRKCNTMCLRTVLATWIELFKREDVSFVLKERSMRLIIEPFLTELCRQPQEALNTILDDDMFDQINRVIWSRDCRPCSNGSCVIAVEEIQMSVLLINLAKANWTERWVQLQRDTRKFLFNRIQSLDCSVRYSALYTLGMVLIDSQASSKDIFFVFEALLRSPTADIRAVLKQSFDLFLPYLAKQGPETQKQLLKHLCKCLSKEGFLMTLVVSLWQSINYNRDTLFPLAEELLGPLIASFARYSPMAFAAPDSRQSTMDLAQTILNWSDQLKSDSPLRNTVHFEDQLVNGLIRILCSLPDYSDGAIIFERGLTLLMSAMEGSCNRHAEYGLRLAPLERMLALNDSPDESQLLMITNGIRLLSLIIHHRSDHLIPGDLPQYEKWLRSLVERGIGRLIEPTQGLLSVIFKKLSRDDETLLAAAVEDLRDWLASYTVESLNNGRNSQVCFAILTADPTNFISAEQILPAFCRAFVRLSREHVARQEALSPMAAPTTAELQAAQTVVSQVLIPGIKFGVCHLGHSEMPRNLFLGALQSLWEHNVNTELLEVILNQLLRWICSNDSIPSLREKVELLLVPCKTEPLGEARLMELFLEIVYEVYARPAYAKTELRSRLEGAFLRGIRSDNLIVRRRFADLLDSHVPRNVNARLRHIFETQRWELAGSNYWITNAMELILCSASDSLTCIAPIDSLEIPQACKEEGSITICEFVGPLLRLLKEAASSPVQEHVRIISFLITLDDSLAHGLWIVLFPALWSGLGPDTHAYLNGRLVRLLANDSYLCQARMRPSVIKSFVEGLLSCRPLPHIPPFLIAYVMKTYATWYSGCSYLERVFEQLPLEINPADVATREQPWLELVTVMGGMYRELGETDFMFGAYRRGFLTLETNVALSFDQMDLWGPSQKLLEGAMSKCRAGTVPFCEAEFSVWEERWVAAAKELQQWDLLTEISRADVDAELGLECLWRLADWGVSETHVAAANLLKSTPEPTFRFKFFEAFLNLTQGRENADRFTNFQKNIEEALQLALHEWQALPLQPCPAHSVILHNFQMIVEIQESLALYSNLASAGSGTSGIATLSRPQFLADLKGLLTAWRERLPNPWDEMNYWSDILAWRQHVFATINNAFAPLINEPASGAANNASGATGTSSTGGGGIPTTTTTTTTTSTSNTSSAANNTSSSGSSTTHPFAFRGYHEMAWLINRFAHVARKNHLTDVCLSFLNRIYTLPNIEIQDAFLKLREQAKCYMDSPTDLPTALEVVNATNLNYFSGLQKGEFFALRSVILARLGMVEEANRVFAQAVQIDLNMGHGWAAWGRFNDQRFNQSQDINLAVNAVNCYLQAATLFKAHQSRRFLARILWLLTFEDAAGSLGKSFEMYNHELPTWFWVSFLPQLLASLARKEQRQARFVLIKIAKNYPQALYLPLRTFHEDCRLQYGSNIVRSNNHNNEKSLVQPQSFPGQSQVTTMVSSSLSPPPPNQNQPSPMPQNGTQPATSTTVLPPSLPVGVAAAASTLSPNLSLFPPPEVISTPHQVESVAQSRKHPLESAEDLLSILKTGYPLLALTMENAMEHIVHRLRSTVDEDFYRVLTSLIGEAYQHIMNRISGHGASPGQTNALMEASLRRVYTMICNSSSLGPLYKNEFERDFMTTNNDNDDGIAEGSSSSSSQPNEVLERLFVWRGKLEPSLKRHPRQLILDGLSRFLAEFEYHRYDDIDVPGQYLLMRDGNQDFVKIDKFDALVPVVRRHGTSYRRLIVRGSDGQLYPFAVQNPAGRQTRREERVLQLLRFLDVALKKGLDCRRRNLYFNVPAVIPISAHVRLVADDAAHVTFEEILDRHCEQRGVSSEQIFLYFKEQILAVLPNISSETPRMNVELLNLRTDLFTSIIASIVPGSILTKYMDQMSLFAAERWIYRKDFIHQLGTLIFQNYVFSIGHRFLHKLGFSKKTTAAIQTEVLPMVTASGQISLIEVVPFRFTPNLQDYVTPIGTEGVLLSTIVACARCLSKADSDLSEFLSIFIRDELLLWYLNYCSIQQQQQQQQQQGEAEGGGGGGGNFRSGPVVGEIVENPFEKLETAGIDEKTFFSRVQQNCELIIKRAQTLSCIKEQEQVNENPVPLFQTVLDLISSATNPQKLAQMDGHWHPWF